VGGTRRGAHESSTATGAIENDTKIRIKITRRGRRTESATTGTESEIIETEKEIEIEIEIKIANGTTRIERRKGRRSVNEGNRRPELNAIGTTTAKKEKSTTGKRSLLSPTVISSTSLPTTKASPS
jgi:hypothetical protein